MPTQPDRSLTRARLVDAFHTYAKPRAAWRVGVELERHLLRPDGMPVPYFGESGVRFLLDALAARGWDAKLEGENPIALFRRDASVTLEPGSQFELSTAPYRDVAGVAAEAAAFVHEVDELIGDRPIAPVALGYTPYAPIDAIAWVPKGRYVVMREYLGQTGELAHHMMKGTCAVQAGFDFADEADCARKVRLGMLLGPLTTATFANSPILEGRPSGYMSFRGHVWTRTDPRRTGFPDAARNFGFERWVDYLLDVPMMFFHDDDHGWRPAHGRTFREWMERGIDGSFPNADAWDLHQTSVFPEVRVKRFIEVRGADCVQHPLAMAFAAWFTGLYYDEVALGQALEIAERFASHGTSADRFAVACRDGLEGTIGGRRLAAWAEDVTRAAAAGLDRIGTDRRFLAPLERQIATGESPARAVLRAYAVDPRPAAMIDFLRYRTE